MKPSNKILLTKKIKLTILMTLISFTGFAQDSTSGKPSLKFSDDKFLVEWNAGLLPFGGIGGAIGYKPACNHQIKFGLGAFTITLPQFGLGEEADKGWTVKDNTVFTEFAYYFRNKPGGFYSSIFALYQQRSLSNTNEVGTSKVQQYMLALQLGYQWIPFENLGLYITPDFTLSVRVGATGESKLGNSTFHKSAVLPLPGVNIGWEF